MMIQFKGIRSIKTDKWEKNIKVVWFSTSNENDLKNFLVKVWIVVMWFQTNVNPVWTLYEIVLKNENGNYLNIIFPVEWKLREAFDILLNSFWNKILEYVDYLRPYGSDISEDKLKLIYQKLLEEKWLLKKNQEDLKLSEHSIKDKKELHLTDKLKEELLKNVWDFINEMEEFLPRVEEDFPFEANKIKIIVWNLKKYRISTNLYKLSENYKEGLILAEKLYEKYFEYERRRENRFISIKILSELEIVKEYKKYEKVQRAKILEKVDSKEFWFPWYEVLYYKLFWKIWLYLKLLFAGYYKKYKNKWVYFIVSGTEFIQFLLIFLIIDYVVLSLYFHVSGTEAKELASFLVIIYLWYFWVFVTTFKLVFEKNKFFAFLVILFWLILFPIFKNFFAL